MNVFESEDSVQDTYEIDQNYEIQENEYEPSTENGDWWKYLFSCQWKKAFQVYKNEKKKQKELITRFVKKEQLETIDEIKVMITMRFIYF